MNIICSLWFIHSSHTFAQLLIYTRFTASEITWCTSWVSYLSGKMTFDNFQFVGVFRGCFWWCISKFHPSPWWFPRWHSRWSGNANFTILARHFKVLTSNRLMIVMKVCVCVSSSFFNTNNFKAFKILWIISRFGSLARMQYNAAFVVCFARFFSESLHAVKPVAVEALASISYSELLGWLEVQIYIKQKQQ